MFKNIASDLQGTITGHKDRLKNLTDQCQGLISVDTSFTVHRLTEKATYISTNIEALSKDVAETKEGVRQIRDYLNPEPGIENGVLTIGKLSST